MFTLTLIARSLGVPLVQQWFIGLLSFVLLLHSVLLPSKTVISSSLPNAPTGFLAVETFDGLVLGALGGQGGWQATNAGAKVATDPDPNHSTNRVMWLDGTNLGAYKSFPVSIADSTTGTLHFRLRRSGPVDGYSGSSAQGAPQDFSSFETQLGGKLSQQANSFVARDGVGFKDILNGFTDNTWHCVWIVANNQSDSYAVYAKGGIYPTITRLDAAGDGDFSFRNSIAGNVGALLTFYTKVGDTNQGEYYIDDIYVDPTAENLSVPGADCGANLSDVTPPTLIWTSPVQNGESYQAGCGTTVTLAVNATDAGGVNRVEFWRRDEVNELYIPLATDSTPPYQTTLDVCTLNFGWNEIDAIAVDNVGNQAYGYIWLQRNAPPTVNAGVDQTITLPAGVTLNGAVTDDNLPNPPNAVNVAWSRQSGPGTVTFANGGATATTATFSAPGLYTLRLSADDGQFVTTDDLLVAVNSGTIAPTPNFTASVRSGIKPLTVNFSDRSTGNITNWLWDFGDGGISVQQNPSHTYAGAGEYAVSLTLSGPGGTSTKIEPVYIRVTDPPAPDVPVLAPIENSDLNGAYTVAWSVGVGVVGYELQEQSNSGAWNGIYSGVATNLTLTNKANGAWCYQVRALNLVTSSAWSSAQCTTVRPPPTETVTPTITPTVTPRVTPTATVTPPTAEAGLYLPMISIQPTPPLVVTPSWRRVSQGKLNLAALALTTNADLFVSERRDSSHAGGLYRRSLVGCPLTTDFARQTVVNESILGILFSGVQGLLAADQAKGIYYSADRGANWRQTESAINRPRTIALVNGNYYVGTEEEGIYLSTNGGATWSKQTDKPRFINVVKQDSKDPTILWVGADGEGISVVTTNINRVVKNDTGLSGEALRVWDFAFDTINIYVGTFNGVFYGNGVQPWQPFGAFPTSAQVYSLEIMGAELYAGTRDGGVWHRPLDGSQPWTRLGDAIFTVRDLLYDPAHCQGLIAATIDGVWLYR